MHRIHLLIAVLAAASCTPRDAIPEALQLRIATGTQGGGYHRLGSALAAALTRDVSGVAPSVELSDGSIDNIERVERGDAEAALAQSDAIYAAYQDGTPALAVPHARLRAIARLHPNAVHIAVRADSDIRRLGDLAGRRIAVNDPGGGAAARTLRYVLESYGIADDRLNISSAQRGELLATLRGGSIDVAVAVSGYPVPAILEIASAMPVRLIGMDAQEIHRTRSRFQFFRPVTIAAGTYRGQTSVIETVGIDTVLICRDSLPEQVVFDLTRVFFEALNSFAADVPGARLIDADHAPATPIPLHPGAARYYRERELFE